MPVDKLEEMVKEQQVYTGINIANLIVFKEEMEVIPQLELLI